MIYTTGLMLRIRYESDYRKTPLQARDRVVEATAVRLRLTRCPTRAVANPSARVRLSGCLTLKGLYMRLRFG